MFEKTHQVKLGGKIIESPALMFYHDHVDYSFYNDAEQIEKEKKISMIVSGIYANYANYQKRIELLVQILNSDFDIDIYGRGLNLQDKSYKGELKYKYDGLWKYEYSIDIENANEKTTSLKICRLFYVTPYHIHGAPNIAEVYDPGYYRTIDLDSPTIIQDLKEIIASQAPNSSINKEIYFKQYNLYTKLKEIVFS